MSQQSVRYSVIVPCFNGRGKIGHALAALVRQSIEPSLYEIIVVDDGSTQNIAEIVTAWQHKCKSHTIRYLRRERGGPAAARNTGIREAQGDMLFFTDDDCELPAVWMESHLQVYRRLPGVANVSGWYETFHGRLTNNAYEQCMYLIPKFLSGYAVDFFEGSSTTYKNRLMYPGFNTANFSVRKEAAIAIGLFDQRFVAAGWEDYDFSQRLMQAGFECYYLPLAVRHFKHMTLTSFLRTAVHRSKGFHTYRSKEREQHGKIITRRQVLSEWRNFYYFLRRFIQTDSSVAWKKWKLILLAGAYFSLAHTGIGVLFFRGPKPGTRFF